MKCIGCNNEISSDHTALEVHFDGKGTYTYCPDCYEKNYMDDPLHKKGSPDEDNADDESELKRKHA